MENDQGGRKPGTGINRSNRCNPVGRQRRTWSSLAWVGTRWRTYCDETILYQGENIRASFCIVAVNEISGHLVHSESLLGIERMKASLSARTYQDKHLTVRTYL